MVATDKLFSASINDKDGLPISEQVSVHLIERISQAVVDRTMNTIFSNLSVPGPLIEKIEII